MSIKKILNSNKMLRLVASLLGKEEDLSFDAAGKIVLTDAEAETVKARYGDKFFEKLSAMSFAKPESLEDNQELFDAAVEHMVNAQTTEYRETIAALQDTITQLAAEPEPRPQVVPIGGIPAGGVNLNMAAKHNAVISSILRSGRAETFAALESGQIDVSELKQEFDITMPPNVRLELITKRLYMGFPDAKHMTRVQSNTDYIASDAIISEVSQEFTAKWTPKGTMKFTPIRIPYRRHKINVAISPASILESWLMFLYEQGKTMQEMPITKYIIENHILPKILDDITRAMIGKGKYEAASADVQDGDAGRPAAKSMDGYETILVEDKKSGRYNINHYKAAADPFAMEDVALLKYVDGFVDAIADFFVGNLTIHCSPQFLTRYQRADFAINGKYTGENIGTAVRFTKFSFIPLESMYNSPILFATSKENFVELVDYSKADRCINKIEEQNYDVKIFGEYSLSVGFKIGEAVFAAVPDGYDPSAAVIIDTPAVGTAESKWTYGGTSTDDGSEEKDTQSNLDAGETA